jgi:predicted NBD/HSP70 family sugar kinase
LEINVDYLAAAVVDLTGAVRHLEVRQADQRDRAPGDVLADVAELAARARDAVDVPLAGARLAVPGLVDAHGLVRLAPNLGWRDLDVLGPLTSAPHWPGLAARIDNEANLAALGELSAADRERSFLYVSGEVGIGAGIVVGGALLRGTHGWSGEIGHVTIAADGPTCRCGARGCLEQYAGQEAILRAAGVPAGEPLPADLAVRRLAELAGAGDPATLGALAAAGTALGIAAAGVVNLLDLDAVVLGGSFAPLAGWLCGAVERELATRVLTAAWSPVPVRACALGTRAAVVGAAGAVVREVQSAPANWVDG